MNLRINTCTERIWTEQFTVVSWKWLVYNQIWTINKTTSQDSCAKDSILEWNALKEYTIDDGEFAALLTAAAIPTSKGFGTCRYYRPTCTER